MKPILTVLAIALFLRVLWLPQNLFFGFEQGRDMLAVAKIINFEDLRLIGANTDVDGVFHGVFYYYFLVPIHALTGGDPLAITYFLIFLNAIGVYFLYRAVKEIFGEQTALLSSFFYAVSYSAIIYARWLSNPNLIPFLAIILFYALVRARSEKWFISLAAVCWGLIFHLSLATASTLVLPILFFIFLYKIIPSLRHVLFTIVTLLIIFSPYIVFDFKNDHILANKLLAYTGNLTKEKNYLAAYEVFFTEAADNLMPFNRNISLVILGAVLFWVLTTVKNKQTLAVAGFIVLPVLFYSVLGITPIRHVYIALPPFLGILFAAAFLFLAKSKYFYLGTFLAVLVVFANLWHSLSVLPESKGNFLQRSQRTYLGDQKKVLDYIYTSAAGEPFSYEYFSVPWWKSEAWEYLFLWYGKNNYGYMPSEAITQTFYSVWEPDETIPIYKDNWYGVLNTASNIIDIKQFGSLGVEKRTWKQKI
ncbi:MAG: hypothetical protein A3A58_00125 [Candidatus Blackburnbacteria bacterium RIFCSPLOWO2_01_FULL_41_27]|uniref:Glycosyltransferase RgtA/B/C/D-like domain-containing protein n=2 Tax=Candidatus Blackburniibacteriota TaxID=1817898 RepID=A0A1G1VCM2_9BACT|nr:MAG: hypothetical protein A3A58_00125 [Candidatus Blackburnbacteria bacterium RIFCSPLOWO2_01_FULL_41_27]OGY12972.1 MAG: hypothetical protein A3F61_00955 [Candidatus Blackburnbacteria bacterium RIFCSPHIGHO2_12_FULL_41_13b]